MDKPISYNSFLGTGWAFPPQFGRSGQVAMVSDAHDIHESLFILLSTRPGERVMHPLYGCALRSIVFENVSESLKTEVRAMITRAIERCEPRVTVELVSVYMDPARDGVLVIEVMYRIRATNTVHNLVYPFYLATGMD
jgi:phage baseplate assembly protein W